MGAPLSKDLSAPQGVDPVGGELVNPVARPQGVEKTNKSKVSGIGGTWYAENSLLNTQGAPIEIIEIAGKHFLLRHIDIHLALYEFFTNFGSVMDRLAYEINLIYALGIQKVDWPKLTNVKQGKDNNNLRTLDSKDAGLTRFIRNCTSQFTQGLGYRNRLTHDGIIRIEVNVDLSGLRIMLAEDCNNDTSPMNVDAVSFCEQTRADVLKLLDGSYELMLHHMKSDGKPPGKFKLVIKEVS